MDNPAPKGVAFYLGECLICGERWIETSPLSLDQWLEDHEIRHEFERMQEPK